MYQEMMESIEIKSKRNIHRKRYRNHLQWKKEMTPTLGLSFGRLFFKKKIFAQSNLYLKNNFKNKNLKMIFFYADCSRGNCTAMILPPILFLKLVGCLRTHRFLCLFLVFDAHQIPPWHAGACNTLKEPARGLWGILN